MYVQKYYILNILVVKYDNFNVFFTTAGEDQIKKARPWI